MKKYFPRIMKVDSPEYKEYIEYCSREAFKEETENDYDEYCVNNDK